MDNKIGKCDTLYWGLPNDIDLKPIAFAKSDSCSLTLEDSRNPLKEDTKGFNMSFDMRISKKDGDRLLLLLGQKKERLPRKKKKRVLKQLRTKYPLAYESCIKGMGGRQTALFYCDLKAFIREIELLQCIKKSIGITNNNDKQ